MLGPFHNQMTYHCQKPEGPDNLDYYLDSTKVSLYVATYIQRKVLKMSLAIYKTTVITTIEVLFNTGKKNFNNPQKHPETQHHIFTRPCTPPSYQKNFSHIPLIFYMGSGMTIQEQWKEQWYQVGRHQKRREFVPKNRYVGILVRILQQPK